MSKSSKMRRWLKRKKGMSDEQARQHVKDRKYVGIYLGNKLKDLSERP